MTLGPKLYIDSAALKHNLQRIKELAPKQAVLAMIKANAYGHGLWNIVSALDDVDALGVARLQDALILRARGMLQRIVVMNGFANEQELRACAQQNLEAVIHTPQQLEILQQGSLVQPINAWLKINTGMNRLGFPLNQAQDAYDFLQNSPNIKKPITLMTHFACADELANPMTTEQMQLFNEVSKHWQGARSLANSAAILGWPDALGDWVRPGIILYGCSPFIGNVGTDHNLKPVMTLASSLIAIYDRFKGDKVGYGSMYECEEAMRVGIVAIGYGDGYPRHAPSGTPVWIHHQRCPLVGRVSMDLIAVDLRACPNAAIGDKVVLWGPQLPVEYIARQAGSIGYELLCNMARYHPYSQVTF